MYNGGQETKQTWRYKMSSIKIAEDMKNTFKRAGFLADSVFIYGQVVIIKFDKSEMENAEKAALFLGKAGFIKIEISSLPSNPDRFALMAEIEAA